MPAIDPTPSLVTSAEALARLYGTPDTRSVVKETTRLTPGYRAFVEAAPFLVLATVGPDCIDCSPRGDAPGFVHVVDDTTLLVPDRAGNRRLDSLRNVLHDPRVGLYFLVPGVGETLRVKGRAAISDDAALCGRFAVDGRLPRTVLVVTVERVYFQCARAVLRGGLWDPARQLPRDRLPTAGELLAQASDGVEGGPAYDAALPGRLRATLY